MKKFDIQFNTPSLIIGEKSDFIASLKYWINPNKALKAELLYRLSKDGNGVQKFHKLCDGKGQTVTLVNIGNKVIGGYTPLSWASEGKWKRDNYTFIFNLTNKKKFVKSKDNIKSIYCLNSRGLRFANFGFNHQMDVLEYYPSYTDFLDGNQLIPNYTEVQVEEVEIYKISTKYK